MAELNIHLNLRVTPKVLRVALAVMLMSGMAQELASESVTLTTYYPAPSGVYTQMITTSNTYLARDGGAVGVGTTNLTNAQVNIIGNTKQDSIYAVNTHIGSNSYGIDAEATGGNTGALGNTAGYFAAANAAGYNYAIDVPLNFPPAGANNFAFRSDSTAKIYFAGNVGVGHTDPANTAGNGGKWIGFADLNDGRNVTDGITWYNEGATSYGIYRTQNLYGGCANGAWCAGTNNWYQQLEASWSTGLILDGGYQYGLSGTNIQPGAGPAAINMGNPGSNVKAYASLEVGTANIPGSYDGKGIIVTHAVPATGGTCAVAGWCHFGAGTTSCPAGTFATMTSGVMAKYTIIDYPGASTPGSVGDPTGEMICEACPVSAAGATVCPSL